MAFLSEEDVFVSLPTSFWPESFEQCATSLLITEQ